MLCCRLLILQEIQYTDRTTKRAFFFTHSQIHICIEETNIVSMEPRQEERVLMMRVVSPLKTSLYVFNGSVGILGMMMAIYAGILFVTYHRTGLIDDAPARPWSLYVMGSIGGLMILTSVTGCAGTAARVTRGGIRTISTHVGVLVVTICVQSIVSILIFSKDAEWKHHLPEDPSGFWTLFSEYLTRHEQQAKLACISLLCMELFGLSLVLWLRSLYEEVYQEMMYDVEEQRERERQVLGDAAQHSYEGGVASVWNARAHSKYGIESGRLRQEADMMQSVVTPLLGDD